MILNADFQILLANPRHLRLQNIPLLVLHNVHLRRDIIPLSLRRLRTGRFYLFFSNCVQNLSSFLCQATLRPPVNCFLICRLDFSELNYWTEIGICFGFASSAFGRVTVRTPSVYVALI
jgi:hypothetical protein